TNLNDVAAEKLAAADSSKPEEGATVTTEQQTAYDDATKEADQAKQEADNDERDDTDYCKYVAVGTEAVAMVQQTMAQQEINSVPLEQEASAQKASLMRVARGYKEREKNAQTQT